jgi:hypothetical protein
MWRPENWSNPYHQEPQGNFVADEANPKYCIYEAGADAMLEALRKQGLKIPREMMSSGEPHTLVFIPDEKGVKDA